MRKYHVGLRDGGRGVAVFEFRQTVDELDCEILDYFGERITTKTEAKSKRPEFLAFARKLYPHRNFTKVRIS